MVNKAVCFAASIASDTLQNRIKEEEHCLGRRLLAYGLKTVYGIDLSQVTIEKTEQGKPILLGCENVHFNISHSGGAAICALGPVSLGVDLQIHEKRNFTSIQRKMMTENEIAKMKSSSEPEKYFYDCWVKKEAYTKWKGCGITIDLRREMKDAYFVKLPVSGAFSAVLCLPCRLPIEFYEVSNRILDT